MAHTASSVEQEVFECERVRITIAVPATQELVCSYRAVYPKALPDDAPLSALLDRVNVVLGATSYGVVNPLGSPLKISGSCLLANLRAYYDPPKLTWRQRLHVWLGGMLDGMALDSTPGWQ